MFRKLALGMLYWLAACGAQADIDFTGPAEEYSLQLSINERVIDGEVELTNKLEKGLERENEILEAAVFEIVDGRSYGFKITLTDHLGTSEEVTGNDLVAYGTYGCLTVSKKGLLTVSPDGSSTCISRGTPQLMVAVARPDGSKLLLNQYFFKVIN